MGKGEFSDQHVANLAAEFTEEELRDRRRKYPLPAGMVIGSPEHLLWRAQQDRLRQRLYNKRSYLKRRKATLALNRYEAGQAESMEAALKAVDDELARTAALDAEETKLIREAAKGIATEDYRTEVDDPEIPFVREMADKHSVSYADALRIMNDDTYLGDESFIAFKAKSAPE